MSLIRNEKAIVKINNLNVRKGPSLNEEAIELCKPGVYRVLDRINGFIKIAQDKWIKEEFTEIKVEKPKIDKVGDEDE